MSALEIAEADPVVIETVAIADIQRMPEFQIRSKGTDRQVVADYARALEGGADFPKPLCFRFKKSGPLVLVDGAHRVESRLKVFGPEARIEVEVRTGTKRDALVAALESGQRVGLRFSNADKRRAVGLMLDDAKLSKESDHELAARAGVSQPFVSKMRKEREREPITVIREGAEPAPKTRAPKVTRVAPGTDVETAVSQLTAQLEAAITQWPDSAHPALRALLVQWTDALTPGAAS